MHLQLHGKMAMWQPRCNEPTAWNCRWQRTQLYKAKHHATPRRLRLPSSCRHISTLSTHAYVSEEVVLSPNLPETYRRLVARRCGASFREVAVIQQLALQPPKAGEVRFSFAQSPKPSSKSSPSCTPSTSLFLRYSLCPAPALYKVPFPLSAKDYLSCLCAPTHAGPHPHHPCWNQRRLRDFPRARGACICHQPGPSGDVLPICQPYRCNLD